MTKKIKGLITMIIVACISTGYFYEQNNKIDNDEIDVEISKLPKELKGLKIVQVSDVHLPQNKDYIKNLINNVKKQNPDIILMTGDIMDSCSNIKDSGIDGFSREISKIAPTFAVRGNHEVRSGQSEEWTKILEDNGIKVVENKIEIFEKNNKKIAILGADPDGGFDVNNYENYSEILNLPKILLSHIPERFKEYFTGNDEERVDLVFTGHAHGGQFRFPYLKRGVVAPGQGIFPKLISGPYYYKNGTMVVSRGLGNGIPLPRLNNFVHLPIIILK